MRTVPEPEAIHRAVRRRREGRQRRKDDNTTEDATITNNTSVMMTGVAGDDYAIGYVSLGSLNDTVKALIDGVEPTVENIKSDSYKVYRTLQHRNQGRGKRGCAGFHRLYPERRRTADCKR
ncbi:MAG: hypothetical protein V8Q27_01635 [Eubacteriales bacterium]